MEVRDLYRSDDACGHGGMSLGMYYFIDSGYARIAEMQKMEAVWQKKAPLADISTCDGKPCVKVDTRQSYGDKKDTYLIIRK